MVRLRLPYPFVLPLILLLLLACAAPGLGAETGQASVRVVMDNNYPPFAFLDRAGRLQGILVDQWRLWERKTGIRAELSGMEWGQALRRMDSGEFDVIDTIFKTDDRLLRYDFTLPFQRIEVPIFFHRDISGITDAGSLIDFPVAVKTGDANIDFLERHGVSQLLYFPSYEAIIRAASEHKVSVFVVDKPPALYFLNKFGITAQFRTSAPLHVGEFHRAVRKGNAGLLQTVEHGFAAISPREYGAIERKWFGTGINGPSLKKFAYAAGGAGLVMLVLVGWNLTLRRAVSGRTAELAAGEERYRTLVENIPLGISLIGNDHRIVMANRTLGEMLGRDPASLVGLRCNEEFEKRETPCSHCPGVVSITTGGAAQVETEGVREDGSRFSARIRTVPIDGPDGTPAGFIEVVEDITERKQARQSLENERTRLSTLLQTIPDLVWLKDPQGVYLACNARFERFFGAQEADIVGKTDYDFVDRELADFFRAHDCKALETGGPSINEEWVTFADDGHSELLETIKTPMRDPQGNLVGVLGIARNITRMRQAEESLRESEVRYRHLVDVSPYAIYVHQQGLFVFANPAGCRLLGATSPDELIGKPILERVHPDYREAVAARVKAARDSGESVPPLEELFLRLDGTAVAVEVVASVLTYHGQPAMQVLAKDISERKRLEEELIRAQKLESLGVLAGGIAHDFNNILTGIVGNVSFAQMLIGEEHKASQRLTDCVKAALRAGELTQQLLTFARGGEPVRKAVNPKLLVEESISFTLRGANVKGIVECPDEAWWVDADPGQVNQVFGNLLINAKQAMPAGGIVTVRIENLLVKPGNRYAVQPGRYVQFAVADQGGGIPPEHLPKIFDPYFTTKPQGSGLGLASVYSIIRRHGGMITASSSLGEGSCFTLLLPAAERETAGEINGGAAVAPIKGKGRILLMDDEEIIRSLAATILQEQGYAVDVCTDGREAISLHGQALEAGAPYGAVILDLTVPGGMGGKEAAALIRQRDQEVPLIVSSGYSGDAIIADFSQFGFSGAVAKPYTIHTLTAELARVLKSDPRRSPSTGNP